MLNHAATHSHSLTENFQFPGKAVLQAEQANTTAKIARFAYEAAIRDLRAAVETGYYQVLLDDALIDVSGENIENLHQVLKVTEIAYQASRLRRPISLLRRSIWRRLSSSNVSTRLTKPTTRPVSTSCSIGIPTIHSTSIARCVLIG